MKMSSGVWTIVGVVAAGLISWGAWNTLATANATPRQVFDKHCEAAEKKFDAVQDRIEDKLDKIQETILELHRED